MTAENVHNIRKRKICISPDKSISNEESCKRRDDSPLCGGNKSMITDPSRIEGHVSDQDQHDCMDLDAVIKQLEGEITMSEERLRKLKMTKMYREKNNLEELGELIEKWRNVSQEALGDLLQLHPPPRPSMTELLTHLQIDFNLIEYNQEDGAFV